MQGRKVKPKMMGEDFDICGKDPGVKTARRMYSFRKDLKFPRSTATMPIYEEN